MCSDKYMYMESEEEINENEGDENEGDENEGEMIETVEEIFEKLDQVATTVSEGIYNIEDKIQDDLELIAFVEGNLRLYAKGKAGYKNVQEKDMAWVSIGKALKHPISGSEAKHRWDTLRNLYGRARREISILMNQQGRSSSGKDDVSYEKMLTPQSLAIHRFMAHMYVPRKTVSNYTKSMLSASCRSSSSSESQSRFSPKPPSKSFLIRPHSRPQLLSITDSEGSTTSPINSPTWNRNSFENIFEKISDNESTNSQINKRSFSVPVSDIKKRKTDLETESLIKESLQAIIATCSALPTLLSNTTSKTDTEEDKSITTILLQRFKHVPVQQKTRCLIELLEVLESYVKIE